MRVLALGGGMGTVLGQSMRCLAVARRLVLEGDEVLCGHVGHRNEAVDTAGVPVEYLPPPPGEPRFDRWRSGGRTPDPEAVAAYLAWTEAVAAEEEALARRFRPQVVVAGSLTGPRVARAVGVPSVFVVLQPRGAATLRMLAGPLAERLRASVGLATAFVVEGMPELAEPGADTPWGAAAVHHVGPLLLAEPDELPPRPAVRRRFGAGDEPLVWLTVGGGSGLIGAEFLALAARAFEQLPGCRGLISTGFQVEDAPAGLPPNVRAARFFPGEEAVWASDAVVFHGGSSTLMHLVGLGRPGVAVPTIDEQRDNAAALRRCGAGVLVEPEGLTPEALAGAVRRVLDEPAFRHAAEHLARLAAGYGGARRAAAVVREVASSR